MITTKGNLFTPHDQVPREHEKNVSYPPSGTNKVPLTYGSLFYFVPDQFGLLAHMIVSPIPVF